MTTRGRVSGKPHSIEIWFGLHGTTVFMLSGGRDKSDWVRNIAAYPHVWIRIGDREFQASARIVDNPEEDTRARKLLFEKYQKTYSGDLMNWSKNSLPVAVDL